MKKWRDIDEVVKMIHDLPNEKLRRTEKEMQKKPKFDKFDIKLKSNKKNKNK
ncbi:MAG: hypothetical protein ACRCX2_14350 [Paraclostridium sp.]